MMKLTMYVAIGLVQPSRRPPISAPGSVPRLENFGVFEAAGVRFRLYHVSGSALLAFSRCRVRSLV